MTREEALVAAAAEGVTLVPSAKNRSGFWGVKQSQQKHRVAFEAVFKHQGSHVYIGTFDSAEEAALVLARRFPAFAAAALQKLHDQEQRPAPVPLTRQEVEVLAQAEGLTLLLAPAGASPRAPSSKA